MSDISRSKKLLLGSALLSASISASAAIDLSSPTSAWMPVLQGVQFDLNETTPNDTLDFVGDTSHAMLYMQYDEGATPGYLAAATDDDEVAFRVRVTGSGGSTMLKGYHRIYVDMNGDNVIDGAIGFYGDGDALTLNEEALFYVRDPLSIGTTPNNTLLKHTANATTEVLLPATSISFTPVSAANNPDATDYDLYDTGGTDYFLSVKFPWSYIRDSVDFYESQGDLPVGAEIFPDTELRMTMISSTDHNNIDGSKSDLAGFPDPANRNQTWDAQGALSPVVTFSTDADEDDVDDVTDNCMLVPNPDQTDTDGDGLGDACDGDDDNDGVDDGADNCPLVENPDQLNNDLDAFGDACDDDDDNDGVLDVTDNCQFAANADQADGDGDGYGDVCDGDIDSDGVLNDDDNCPMVSNPGQENFDGDLEGDACDLDDDNDGVPDTDDSCLTADFDLSADNDADGCDDDNEDLDDDNDGIADDVPDNCQYVYNPDQADYDADGFGNVCDTDDDNDGVDDNADACPFSDNPAFVSSPANDNDGDGCEDAVEDDDDDNDGVDDDVPDNCPLVYNPDQLDTDADGQGDVCDTDDDGDGVNDNTDNCPLVINPSQTDSDNDGLGNACDTDDDGEVKTATRGAGSTNMFLLMVLAIGLVLRGRRI